MPWDHPGRVRDPGELDERQKIRLPICPGYLCSLPEVIEASWAHSYWENGELSQFCDGGAATKQLKDAMSAFAIARSKATEWSMKNPAKG